MARLGRVSSLSLLRGLYSAVTFFPVVTNAAEQMVSVNTRTAALPGVGNREQGWRCLPVSRSVYKLMDLFHSKQPMVCAGFSGQEIL